MAVVRGLEVLHRISCGKAPIRLTHEVLGKSRINIGEKMITYKTIVESASLFWAKFTEIIKKQLKTIEMVFWDW